MRLQIGESFIGAEGLGERQKSRMLAFVLLYDASARLVLQKPKQGKQFTEHGNRTAEWSTPNGPAAGDEFVEFREPGYSVPEPISCRKGDSSDVAHYNGHRTERTGFERGPERMMPIVARHQLSQNVELGVGDGCRSKPSWRGFLVRHTISSDGNDTPARIRQDRADADVAPDMRLPSLSQRYLPRLFQR